jgi:hypothetical protein
MAIQDVHALRRNLTTVLEKVSAGELTPAAANAAANVSGKVLATIKMEVDYAKLSGVAPAIPFLNGNFDETKKLEVINNETGEVTSQSA